MSKITTLLLILTSMLGYLEWSDKQMFVFQLEAELFQKAMDNWAAVLHPLTVLPLLGQVLLLITLFQKKPNKMLGIIGLACLSILMVLLLVIGILSSNLKITLFSLPFLLTAAFALWHLRRKAAPQA